VNDTVDMRVLTTADAPVYRVLRLEALERAPEAFSSDYDDNRRLSLAHFADRIAPSADRFVLGAFVNGALVGVAGFVRARGVKEQHKGTNWGMYVTESARGGGVGRGLLEAVRARARALPGLERILLEVTAGNAAAEALYRAVGFAPYGVEPGAIRIEDRRLDSVLMSLALAPHA
jgi:RimJ/RimL family protein N-acetyltransferase